MQSEHCGCVQGSLANDTFGAWNPVSNEMELCDMGNAAGEGMTSDEEEDEDEAEGHGEGEEVAEAAGSQGLDGGPPDEALDGILA
jgi:hypothetical protein